MRVNIHASCVRIRGKGVLLLGASGAGKSDLALEMIDGGAKLVADDRMPEASRWRWPCGWDRAGRDCPNPPFMRSLRL